MSTAAGLRREEPADAGGWACHRSSIHSQTWREPEPPPGPSLVDLGLANIFGRFYEVPALRSVDELPKPTRPEAWGRYSATPVQGGARASKLAALCGRALADGLEPTLALRLIDLENQSSCDPPLSTRRLRDLFSWVLERHSEGD